jgi:thiamine-monophosphate kinase
MTLVADTVADFTEAELIARIQEGLPPAPAWMVVGIGDDAAVVEPERNRLEVLSVDALVEGVHFDREFTPPAAVGHRALAVNLSDLAAMGAAPRLALVSLTLPATLPIADFDQMISGLTALAARHHVHVAGGNLTRSPGPLMIDVTVVGTVKRRQALTRGGSRPGDELWVTGTIGAAAAGLQMLQARAKRSTTEAPEDAEDQTLIKQASASVSPVSSVVESCIQRYLYPEPRVRVGSLLARNRAATACMDLSDGLAAGVHQIAEASGVGAIIDAGALPIASAAREWFDRHGADAVVAAATGGDDYELLFAVRPHEGGRFAAALRHRDAPLTRVGRCTADRAVVLRRDNDDHPLPRGYSHFR